MMLQSELTIYLDSQAFYGKGKDQYELGWDIIRVVIRCYIGKNDILSAGDSFYLLFPFSEVI